MRTRTGFDADRGRRRDAWVWWNSLEATATATPRASRWLPLCLAGAALAFLSSMPLGWHHLRPAAALTFGLPTAVRGVDDGSWLMVVALAALALAARTWRVAPGLRSRLVTAALAFVAVNGICIDYIDWQTRGVSAFVPPYYGPGFFVALGGTGLLVAAAAVAWRTRD